jgi:mitotic spindle assembly checkpoint protein MAD2B
MSACESSVTTDATSELRTVVNAFTKFLTVATHQILHARNIYPARTFILAKDYGLEVYQSRHLDVCNFINSEIEDIHQTILSGMVKRIFVAIFVQGLPREHFVFDITRMSKLKPGTMGEEADFETPFPLVDAEEQMRAVLSKLEAHCTSLEPLNDPRTFRMIMEVDDGSRFSSDDEEEPNTHPGDDSCTKEHAVDMVPLVTIWHPMGRPVPLRWTRISPFPQLKWSLVTSSTLVRI